MVAKEVKLFAQLALDGAIRMLEKAREAVGSCGGFSSDREIGFKETAYYLPLIYALTGKPITSLSDCREPLELAESLIGPSSLENPWLPYLGTALDAGISSLISAEIASAASVKQDGYVGFPTDEWVEERSRSWDRDRVSFVLALGDPGQKIDRVLDELDQHLIDVLATGAPFLGKGERVFALTEDLAGQALAFGVLARIAMMHGIRPGDYAGILDFCRNRLFGFVALFADEDAVARAIAAGGISFGLATIVREYTPQLLPVYSVPRF